MKKYLLLRDNQESGPYTLEELTSLGLKQFDLVWTEGSSQAWQYPEEVSELKNCPIVKATFSDQSKKNKWVFIGFASDALTGENVPEKRNHEIITAADDELSTHENAETNRVQFSALKERTQPLNRKQIWQKKFLPSAGVLNLVTVFLGLGISAVIIKKIVDTSALPDQTETAAIQTSVALPDPNPGFRDALKKETINADNSEKPAIRSVKPKDIKRQISIKSNNYKTGLFGGISKLQLTLMNTSPHFIDRVTIAINYLKPNGDVVESKEYKFYSVKPNGTKVLPIPSSNRGVKISYKITGIYSRQYTAALKQA